MQMIYKYKLEFQPIQIVKLPLKRILTIQIQDGTPCLWALVDTEAPEVPMQIRMAGTGTHDAHDFDKLRFISTTQYGAFVLHWFYENPLGTSENALHK